MYHDEESLRDALKERLGDRAIERLERTGLLDIKDELVFVRPTSDVHYSYADSGTDETSDSVGTVESKQTGLGYGIPVSDKEAAIFYQNTEKSQSVYKTTVQQVYHLMREEGRWYFGLAPITR